MTNTVYDIAKIRVCQTCVIAQENGDTSQLSPEDYDKWAIGVERENVLNNGWEWSGVLCSDANDQGECQCESSEDCVREGCFSWSWCEFCGDTDGGDRWNVAIMRRLV